LAEQFDQLLYKYPMIKFVENPMYNDANNIVSVMCCGPLIRNSYIMEADLFMRNPNLIQKYQYSSNYLAIPMARTDDYCLYTENGIIKGTGLGGINCHQTVGISYWTDSDGARLVDHIKDVYHSPGGKEQFWGSVPLRFHSKDYVVRIRECSQEDIIEIDSFKELKALDPVYNVT
jgi:CTP:phosphocholine cytidylyltransferase-like protein